MVQDQFDPEYYLGQYETHNSNTEEKVWCIICSSVIKLFIFVSFSGMALHLAPKSKLFMKRKIYYFTMLLFFSESKTWIVSRHIYQRGKMKLLLNYLSVTFVGIHKKKTHQLIKRTEIQQ